jgi:hypothetical protein
VCQRVIKTDHGAEAISILAGAVCEKRLGVGVTRAQEDHLDVPL